MNILVPDITIAEKIVRSAVVYGFLLVAFTAVAWMTFRSKRADRLVEHSPTVLVKHGRLLRATLPRECPGPRDLRAALRHHGVTSLRDIRYAFLEEDGRVSVITRRPPDE